MTANARIAKNTLALYFRQILIMLVSLYTVRVVLSVLGAEDYGIYNVVAGIVTMFGFLSGAMATASQRFFSFELGKGNKHELSKIFCVTVTIYAFLSVIIVVLAETAGLYFVNTKLVIPSERVIAAKWIYQCAVVSFIFTLMTTPYLSSIIAHENMNVYAYVSIVEALLKLAVVFLLRVILIDKLILYAILLLCVSVINTGLYRLYSRKHYEECRFKFLFDKKKFCEIFNYVGWNLFGSAVGVFKNQIVNILLNQFFGAAVNAARAIASQISTAVTSFSQNFSTAIRPQIIKTYASEQKNECLLLTFRGCKMTFFLMYIFVLPLVLEMPFILNLWLKNPPEHAVIFTRLVLIDALIDCVSYPIMALAQATGKIKLYQGVVGGILLLNFPASYAALSLGFPAWSVAAAAIVITFIAFIVRLFIVRKLTEFSARLFVRKVCFPLFLTALFSSLLPFAAEIFLTGRIFKFFAVIFLSVGITSIFVLFVGMERSERNSFLSLIKRRLCHA